MSTNAEPRVTPAALDQAFAALAKYDRGSGRETLKPIDDAVNASAGDAELRGDLERRLVAALRSPASVVAKEYACGKLALIGGAAAVAALAELLPHAELAHPATNALQQMTSAEAAAALRDNLPKLRGLPLVGVLVAVGARRDLAGVAKLTELLADPDPLVVSAAGAALGEIASAAAARGLIEFLPKAPAALHLVLGDACLVCAERLKTAGDTATARAVIEALPATKVPEHIQAAARRLGNP